MEKHPQHPAPPYLVTLALALAVLSPLPAAAGQSRQPHHAARALVADQVTRASWYGKEFEGRRTADGTVFHAQHLTAAHRTLDMGTKVRVTELRTGRSVVVKITDRGPYFPGRGIDLSYAAARQLGIVNRGVARVRVEPLADEAPPIITACSAPTLSWLPKAIVE